ncbi:MAG: glycosyltransferase family 2 protein [Clostridiales bacterium]|nr:glycosyltransferase family 2 protein [Clostridiales bacterium]
MSQYSVTGCIVTYNNAKKIKRTLDTVLECTKGVDFKLYVVDNGSTDGTLDIVKQYEQVELIESGGNIGFGAGHNSVLDRLDSKYHVIINPDISVRTDVISSMAAFMDANEDVVLLSPKICFLDGRDQILGLRDPTIKYLVSSKLRRKPFLKTLDEFAMRDADTSKPFDVENASGCFLMVRTELFKKIGGFDEGYFMYFEDADLTRAMRKYGRAVKYSDVIIYHEWDHDSRKNLRLMLIQMRSMMYYFRKWRKADRIQ